MNFFLFCCLLLRSRTYCFQARVDGSPAHCQPRARPAPRSFCRFWLILRFLHATRHAPRRSCRNRRSALAVLTAHALRRRHRWRVVEALLVLDNHRALLPAETHNVRVRAMLRCVEHVATVALQAVLHVARYFLFGVHVEGNGVG